MNSSQDNSLGNRIADAWYTKRWWLWLLLPFSFLFYVLSTCRRLYLQSTFVKKPTFSVPVVVVGNVSVGGTGKTPLIIALCKYLKKQGYRPGVISRGYGSAAPSYPFLVNEKTSVIESGDEPWLIARSTGCPVVIDRDRCAAANKIIESCDVNVVLSDDGLQHYRLPRDIEIVVIDGARGLGNNFLLPAGPLREGQSRLTKADFIVSNGEIAEEYRNLINNKRIDKNSYAVMTIKPSQWKNLLFEEKYSTEIGFLSGEKVHAIAGIGNPQRFYSTLESLGIHFSAHSFPDHYQYSRKDVTFADNCPVVMTEKDAVKIQSVLGYEKGHENQDESENKYWMLSIEAILPTLFFDVFHKKLNSIRHD